MAKSKKEADIVVEDKPEEKVIGGEGAEAKGPQFAIQRIYVKDLSLEVPDSPQVFLEKWEPQLHMDLGTKTNSLENNNHEVILTLTVTVKVKEKTAFLVEIKQAGIFSLSEFAEEQLKPMLGAFCPNILYPYAREAITSVVMRAGFPQLYLTPINFDALYQQSEQKRKEQEKETATAGSEES